MDRQRARNNKTTLKKQEKVGRLTRPDSQTNGKACCDEDGVVLAKYAINQCTIAEGPETGPHTHSWRLFNRAVGAIQWRVKWRIKWKVFSQTCPAHLDICVPQTNKSSTRTSYRKKNKTKSNHGPNGTPTATKVSEENKGRNMCCCGSGKGFVRYDPKPRPAGEKQQENCSP